MSQVHMPRCWLYIIVIGFGACQPSRQPTLEPLELELAEVLRDWRPLEAGVRSDLYGTTDWQPASTLRQQRRVALAKLETAFGSADLSEPRMLLARVLLDLIGGEADRAIGRLEPALRDQPNHGDLLNALAVAHLTRANTLSMPARDLTRALERINQAMLVKETPEIRFNRALILQSLHLVHQADQAWQACLDGNLDSSSERDLRMRLDQLRSAKPRPMTSLGTGPVTDQDLVGAVDTQPRQVREYVQSTLIPAWTVVKNEGAAAVILQQMAAIAERMFVTTGECMFLDEVGHLFQASIDPCSDMATGYVYLTEGYQAQRGFQTDQAATAFQLAHRRLKAAGTAFQYEAAYGVALQEFRRGRYGRAAASFADLARGLPMGYLELRARTSWMIGLIHQFQEHFVPAREGYEQALALYRQLGEGNRVAGAYNRLAEVSFFLGDSDRAWNYNYLARQQLAAEPTSPQHYVATAWAAEMARQQGDLQSTRDYQNEAVAHCINLSEPLALSQARVARAQIQTTLGRDADARQDLAAARRAVPAEPGFPWQAILAQVNLVEAGLSPPAQALSLLDQALSHAEVADQPYLIGEIRWARSHVNRELGRLDAAAEDLERGIEMCEVARARIPDALDKLRFLDARRLLYDAAIHIRAIDRDDPIDALSYLERMRAPEQAFSEPFEPSVSQSHSLPHDVTLISYLVQPQGVLAWVVRREGVHFVTIPVAEADLSRIIGKLQQQLAQRRSIEEVASGLFDLLFAPLNRYIQSGDSLVIVPDRVLHELPFAALFDASKGRWLVQDYAVGYAASITGYQHLLRHNRGQLEWPPRALLLGNPSFKRKRFPRLRSLPFADKEIAQLTRLYPRHTQLSGARATRTAFLNQAGDHGMIHFGGHALGDERFPANSFLIMAPDSTYNDNGLLRADEIAALDLSATQLVVLAACGSARGLVSHVEGPLSLARAFLKAGVPAVMASVGNIQDRRSAVFLSLFHKRLNRGLPPLAALQETQVQCIDESQLDQTHPADWTAFRLMGGLQPR